MLLPLSIMVSCHAPYPFLPRFFCAAFVSALVRSAALRSVVAYFPSEYLLW